MPSKKTSKDLRKSDGVSEKVETDSRLQIEDRGGFVIRDSRRIASFLAQFHEYGLRNQVKATESYGRTSSTKTAIGASGGIPAIVHGKVDSDNVTTDDEWDVAESVYDPLWTNARNLRDYLDASGMIITDIWQAGIGQFVEAQGTLIVLDVATLREAWSRPSIKNIIKGSANQLPEEIRSDAKKMYAIESELDTLVDLLSILPHSTQVS
jgi:hypothetical protein